MTIPSDVILSADHDDAKDRAHVNAGGGLCAQCGLHLPHGEALCWHHPSPPNCDEDWSRGNRVLCNLFHRHVSPPRLNEAERNDPWLGF